MPSCSEVQAIFRASTSWALGDNRSCRFWVDPWVDGRSIKEIAPLIYDKVPRRRRKIPFVRDALADRSWARDISGSLGPAALVQYVHLWQRLRQVTLLDSPDSLTWGWTANGAYTASSCYNSMFIGSIEASHWRLTWRPWAPLRVKVFFWLALRDRGWTAVRLARHGLPHGSACSLCDQTPETMAHLLSECPFSRRYGMTRSLGVGSR